MGMGSGAKGEKAGVRRVDAAVGRRDLLAASAGAVAVGRWAAAAGAGTLATAFLATRAGAQQQTKSKLYDVINRKMLIVGTGNGNPPWHFQDEKGEFAGFDISLARILAKGLFNDPTKVQFVVQAADARMRRHVKGVILVSAGLGEPVALQTAQVIELASRGWVLVTFDHPHDTFVVEQPDGSWHYGFLFSPALTVGGGTAEVQRNIIAERVLGLPHDVDVESGKTWAEARRG